MTEITAVSSNQDENSDLDDFNLNFSHVLKVLISTVRQNAFLIAVIIAGTLLIGVVVTLLVVPEYEASSQILIEDQAEQIIEGGSLDSSVSPVGTERFLQTQIGVINSRSLALNVVQANRLDENAAFFEAFGAEFPQETGISGKAARQLRSARAANLLLQALVVEITPGSRIASITITSRDRELSAKLANEYAEQFIAYNLNQKYDSSAYARQFLSRRLAEVRQKLTKSERDLNSFANMAGLIRLGNSQGGGAEGDTALSVTNSQLTQLNTAAGQATAERIAAEDRWKTIQNRPALSISEVTSNGAVNQLIAARASAEVNLAQERTQHLDEYVTVTAKQAEIAELTRRINALATSVKEGIRTNYLTAAEKENSLNAQVELLRAEALEEQSRGVQYSILKREADTNRALYESLLSRYNQIAASAGAASNNITIVDRAVVPSSPSFPKFYQFLALAFLLGLVLAAIVVALKELLDDAIRSPLDVEKKLGLSLLGLIPFSKGRNFQDKLSSVTSDIREAYRTLVTNLSYSTEKGMPKILAVTSAREGEGKSTTALALAKDLAVLGKSTLLVDADLRRPTLHRTLPGQAGAAGLTDYLIGQKNFDEILETNPMTPGLSYITALPIPPDPSLLLAGAQIEAFFAEARTHFDTIIVDCPPLLGLSDVPLIVEHTEGVLFVIDASTFHRGAVKSALNRLRMSRARLLGVVLNRFEPKAGIDDYSYYQYNYYNYRPDGSEAS